ncbi:MAG: sensor histidine kinase [Alphaproteobacteria bacterium]|nr:sensor histidine kinase [Alphaproteobacteria bacterium]
MPTGWAAPAGWAAPTGATGAEGMLTPGLILAIAAGYLGLLFLLAFISDRRQALAANRPDRGASFVNSPVIYTLSLAVYCTSWTFYGAVGSAARNGLEYLTIYLGPTIVFMGWWLLLRKLVRISKNQKITSIADFLSSRYGKSASLSALVTVIAVLGITPYISLQLKAVASSFEALAGDSLFDEGGVYAAPWATGVFADSAFWTAVLMGLFVILFGTRNTGADERHPGVVAAIAFESVVKLIALAAVAFFAIYGLNGGLQDLFARADWHEGVRRLTTFEGTDDSRWLTTLFLSGAAVLCLPRQFQVAVVENSKEKHLATAAWLFPLYLLLVSLCVIPIAIAGMTQLPETVNPDLYVLLLPVAGDQNALAMFAFIGGLSAATSMVIVSSIALSIMISNHIVTPILLRLPNSTSDRSRDFSETILLTRRLSIVAILLFGFLYYELTATTRPLASIGLISFAGVAQFLPALVLGVYWQGATRAGALAGLVAGFIVWGYTLLVPTFANAGWAFIEVTQQGAFGMPFLRPDALFGLNDLDPLVHGVLWSMIVNVTCLTLVSLVTSQSPLERLQSAIFVDAYDTGSSGVAGAIQRSARADDLFELTRRILGPDRALKIFRDYAASQGLPRTGIGPTPSPVLIGHIERELASSVGAASARSLLSGIVTGETIDLDTVITLLDETQQAIRYSRELEQKSRELEDTAAQLRRANDQLTRLDKMKDDFLSQVSHELRTPMTSIRSFAEILTGAERLDEKEAMRFLEIIRGESERLTRLLDDILDMSRMESGQALWQVGKVDLSVLTAEAARAMDGLARSRGVSLQQNPLAGATPEQRLANADPDRLKQVLVNLLSNAIKFNTSPKPKVWIETGRGTDSHVEILVRDNGPGIPDQDVDTLFTKFSRGWTESANRAGGSGLGLAISKQIVDHLGGSLRLLRPGIDRPGIDRPGIDRPGIDRPATDKTGETGETGADQKGAIFSILLPRAANSTQQAAE